MDGVLFCQRTKRLTFGAKVTKLSFCCEQNQQKTLCLTAQRLLCRQGWLRQGQKSKKSGYRAGFLLCTKIYHMILQQLTRVLSQRVFILNKKVLFLNIVQCEWKFLFSPLPPNAKPENVRLNKKNPTRFYCLFRSRLSADRQAEWLAYIPDAGFGFGVAFTLVDASQYDKRKTYIF